MTTSIAQCMQISSWREQIRHNIWITIHLGATFISVYFLQMTTYCTMHVDFFLESNMDYHSFGCNIHLPNYMVATNFWQHKPPISSGLFSQINIPEYGLIKISLTTMTHVVPMSDIIIYNKWPSQLLISNRSFFSTLVACHRKHFSYSVCIS